MNQRKWLLILVLGIAFLIWRMTLSPESKPIAANEQTEEPAPLSSATPEASLAPPVTASATPSPTPEATVGSPSSKKEVIKNEPQMPSLPLYQIIQKNELCQYIKLNPDRNELAQALLKTGGAVGRPSDDQILNELFSPQGPFLGKIPKSLSDQSQATQLYTGLLAGDLLLGEKLEKPSLKEADRIFNDLEQLDPQNGAYPFFHAAVLQKMKMNPHEVMMAITRSVSETHFETFFDRIESRIFERGMINATAWNAARTITSRLPHPNFKFSESLMESYLGQDPEYTQAVYKLGKLLTDRYQKDLDRHRTLDPLHEENELGISLMKTAQKWMNSEAQAQNPIPEIHPKKEDKSEEDFQAAFQELKDPIRGCRPYSLDRLFTRFKGNFTR